MADEHSQFMVFYSNKHGHTWYNPKRLGAPQVRILRKWGRTWEFRAASFLNKAACFWNCPRNRPGRYILDIYNYVYIYIWSQWTFWGIHAVTNHLRCLMSPRFLWSIWILVISGAGYQRFVPIPLVYSLFSYCCYCPRLRKRLILDLSWFISSGYNKCRFNRFQYTYDMS